ncbi:hypothetical protein CANARDRAFT_8483 [[Candida] arabinofermentans NRRL YB-2248]|uniref:Protein DOM34 homolog n=1 Tax=[Candida] arabinofermentans NRRL YB-2248 TaxID=983967 RepID=A0A1E4SYD4_9ASCO|nr:hypothetical protein CANARDRAFT_8483 [[Candida] arabinofermentans NRRL YB-2248]
MKLLSQSIQKDSSGKITLETTDIEDIYTTHQLLNPNDEISLLTVRNIKPTLTSTTTIRKTIHLDLVIESIDYEVDENTLRLKCRTIKQHNDVPLNSYHTAIITVNCKFTIWKQIWDDFNLNLINESCDVMNKAELGAVVLEEGVAHICLITNTVTVLKNKIEKSIPKKQRNNNNHDLAMTKFLQMVSDSTVRNLDLSKLKSVLVVGPGTISSKLIQVIFNNAIKENNKELLSHKSKFVIGHSSTGYLQGLEEAMKDPNIIKLLNDSKYSKNVIVFDLFTKMLNLDDGKAWYGDNECFKACQIKGSVKYLLITDTLLKSTDLNKRKKYTDLIELVKEGGGETIVFSTLHDSGEQLNQLTGIAVILNYPLPDLDESDDDDDELE